MTLRSTASCWTPNSSTLASSPAAGCPPTCKGAVSSPRRWGSGTSDTPPADGPCSPATFAAVATTTTRSRPPGSPVSLHAERLWIISGTGSCCRSTTSRETSPDSSAASAPAPALTYLTRKLGPLGRAAASLDLNGGKVAAKASVVRREDRGDGWRRLQGWEVGRGVKRRVLMRPPVLQSRFVTWRPPFFRRMTCDADGFELGVVVVPSGAGLVASSPS